MAKKTHRIGIDCHKSSCIDLEGSVDCVCGLDDAAQAYADMQEAPMFVTVEELRDAEYDSMMA